nr:reverse transcriptase domain-containing protein [Tanacetum cinerariifolium]
MTQDLSPTDSLIPDESIPDKEVHLSDDEDSRNDHLPTAESRKSCWKPLPAEERPANPEPTWTITSSNVSNIENNWTTALASTYVTPAENLLLAKTGDMTNFLNWYCRQVNKTKLTQADLEGKAYDVVKAFYLDVIHLQFQMEECHNPALSISKMKATSYPDFGLELLVPKQIWIQDVCTYDISAKYGISHWWFNRQKFYIDRHYSSLCRKEVRSYMRILNVVRIKAYSRYGNRVPINNNERKIMRFNEIYKFSNGTLTQILEALAYRVKEFKIKRLNPAVEKSCVIYGGAHAYYYCIATDSNQSSVCAATGTYNQVSPPNRASNQMAPPGFAPVQNNQNSGLAYEGPSIPTNSSPEKVVERETEETTDKEQPNCQGSTAHIQPPVVPTPIPEPVVPKTLPKPNIPYPYRLNDQRLREKATNQMEKFFQIFHDLHFDISFADALLLMPKFASTIKSLLTNKDKLFELAKVSLNENCSAMLLKKLPEKHGDPGKFLIPCDFPGMD